MTDPNHVTDPTRTAEQVAATDPAYEIYDPGDGNHTPERFPTITTDRAGYEQLVADRDTWKERAHELEALEAQTARQRDGYARRAVAAEAALAAIAALARAAVARAGKDNT